jgi:cytochrome d ubiquinol oxidase subunit I
MESVNAGRALMADSLGFHIIFALLGVGLPLVISFLEFLAIRNKDAKLHDVARKISYISLVLVAAGVVSGTIIAIQMSLMWSGLVKFGGPILGLPFMLEGYAFIFEAIFLSVYVGSWNKIKGYKHWVMSLPIILGALLSAFFITAASSWMQNPTGFNLVNGQITNPRPWDAIFTKTTFFMTSHSILGYYLTTLLLVVACFAIGQLRGKSKITDQKTARYIMVRLSILAVICGLTVGLLGHLSLQYLAKSQPRKFAAIELVPEARTKAPYVIGGSLSADSKSVTGGIRVPYLLSVLTGNSPDTPVPGLNQFPRNTWPMLFINRLFEVKMLFVGLILAAPILFVGLKKLRPQWAYKKFTLWILIVAAPAAFMTVELGWMITEFGRQPFAVNGLLYTKDAFTHSPGVLQWGRIFPTLYLVLFVVSGFGIRAVIKRFNTKGEN